MVEVAGAVPHGESDLEAALVPIVRDLNATLPGFLDRDGELRDYTSGSWRGSELVFAAGGGAALSLQYQSYATHAEASVLLAGDLQEAVWEESWGSTGSAAPWPECPHHPASHPLEPRVTSNGEAEWCCPTNKARVAAIGSLPVRG